MLHKVSEFVNQVRAMGKLADRLEKIKYEQPKSRERDALVDDLISQIKYLALLIHKDNQKYEKREDENL